MNILINKQLYFTPTFTKVDKCLLLVVEDMKKTIDVKSLLCLAKNYLLILLYLYLL